MYIYVHCRQAGSEGLTKEDLGVEGLTSAKKIVLVSKSYLWEGIFINDKCVYCTSLGFVRAKNILLKYFLKL